MDRKYGHKKVTDGGGRASPLFFPMDVPTESIKAHGIIGGITELVGIINIYPQYNILFLWEFL
jgi:hypothetical protein